MAQTNLLGQPRDVRIIVESYTLHPVEDAIEVASNFIVVFSPVVLLFSKCLPMSPFISCSNGRGSNLGFPKIIFETLMMLILEAELSRGNIRGARLMYSSMQV